MPLSVVITYVVTEKRKSKVGNVLGGNSDQTRQRLPSLSSAIRDEQEV